jgi:hypothetical protein
MQALGVVIAAPACQHHAGLRQRADKQLVAQPPVEALDEGVLDRLAGGNVVPGDLLPVRPGQDRVRGQLGAVAHWERNCSGPGEAVRSHRRA